MAVNIPTTKQNAVQNLANIESKTNQTTPLNDKAFNRVISGTEALNQTSLYKYGVDRVKQNLIQSATGDDLSEIGSQYGIIRKAAEAAVIIIELPAITGTIIYQTVDFKGNNNNIRYIPDTDTTAVSNIATITVTAREIGVAGNLNIGDLLTIGTLVAGAESTATVTSVVNTGADAETDDSYRVRILDKVRNPGGGGNAADYRNWSQEVGGVKRAYPYSGRPVFDPVTSVPPDRTVYVEAETSIDPDGIAPTSLLDEVRESITSNLDGKTRQPLGLTNTTLFTESITRTSFYVEIRNLVIASEIEAQVKADIETALTNFFRNITPFVDGLDVPAERNDLVTDLVISDVVQDVVGSNGGSAEGVGFGLSVGTFLPSFLLGQGELGKLGGIIYA